MTLKGALRGYVEDDDPEMNDGLPESGELEEPTEAPVVEEPAAPKRTRRRRSPAAETLGAPPVAPFQRKWENTDAHLLYAEIMNDVQSQGKVPGDVTCFVERVAPPGSGVLPSFSCAALNGCGADAFYAFIVDNYHSRWRGSATYEIRFHWTQTNRKITRGSLKLPPPEDIAQMGPPRAYGLQGSMNQTPYAGVGAPPQQPPMYPGWPPPMQQQQQQQPQQPQYPQQQQQDARVAHLEGLVGHLSGQLQEALTAMREGRSVPAGVAAPPPPAPMPQQPAPYAYPPPQQPQPATQQALAVKAIYDAKALLQSLGVQVGVPAVQPGVGAPAATPATMSQGATGMASEVSSGLKAIQTLKGLYGQLGEIFGTGTVDATAEVYEPEAQGPTLPFDAIPIPDVQIGGHQVHYARNKVTGKLDLEGIVLSNPGIAEKLFGLAGELAKAGAHLAGVSQGAKPGVGAPEIVDEIPGNAQDANGVPPPPAPPNGAGRPYPKL